MWNIKLGEFVMKYFETSVPTTSDPAWALYLCRELGGKIQATEHACKCIMGAKEFEI